MSAPGGVSPPGGSGPGGCLLLGGMAAPGGVGGVCSGGGEVLLLGGSVPACTEADPPPVNRMTNRCKNITLATTSLRLVMILKQSVLDKNTNARI